MKMLKIEWLIYAAVILLSLITLVLALVSPTGFTQTESVYREF